MDPTPRAAVTDKSDAQAVARPVGFRHASNLAGVSLRFMELLPLDLGRALLDYEETWELQRRVHAEVLEGGPNRVLLLEHADVYTAGRRTNRADRPTDGTRVVDVDRGGKITWHGPGQLVAYPIVRLADPVDVVAFVRAIETAVIELCADLGLATERVEGRSGVWVPASEGRRAAKVAAIGCRVAKGVTMHGVAVNACPDLTAFDRIVPCGISDADVTSLSAELGRTITPVDIAEPLGRLLQVHVGPMTAAARPEPVTVSP